MVSKYRYFKKPIFLKVQMTEEENDVPSTTTTTTSEFYRSTTIGVALIDSLNEMMAKNIIDQDEAMKILVTMPHHLSK